MMEPSTADPSAANALSGSPTGSPSERANDRMTSSPDRPASSERAVTHQGLAELCGRRDSGEDHPGATTPLQLAGAQLSGSDLSGLDLSMADLSGANLVGCNLRETRLMAANLTAAVLHNADLSGAELLQADLSAADLTNAVLDRGGLGQVTAKDAIFFGVTCDGATFTGADLSGSDFRASTVRSCRMRSVDLSDVDFTNATLADVDLGLSTLSSTTFRDTDLAGTAFKGAVGYKTCDWINADIHHVDFTGAWLVRRFIQDENYLYEFRTQSKQHERIYKIWSITSDCGRSLGRWASWTVLVALIYAGFYTQVEIDWGDAQTPLSPVYYSVVTFTTLGYGDVLPGSVAAQVLAMSEVVLGYFSLGGMMSILSDKMARRAG